MRILFHLATGICLLLNVNAYTYNLKQIDALPRIQLQQMCKCQREGLREENETPEPARMETTLPELKHETSSIFKIFEENKSKTELPQALKLVSFANKMNTQQLAIKKIVKKQFALIDGNETQGHKQVYIPSEMKQFEKQTKKFKLIAHKPADSSESSDIFEIWREKKEELQEKKYIKQIKKAK